MNAQHLIHPRDWRIPDGGRTGLMRLPVDTGARATLVAAAALLAVAIGVVQVVSFLLAVILVVAVALAVVVVWFDVLGVAVVLTATLPWLVVTSEVLPRLVLTFVAAATAGAILLVSAPKSRGSHASLLLRIGLALFFLPIVISVVREGVSSDAIQAAKYVIFPVMALALTDATNSQDLALLRTVALWSSLAAITGNLLIGLMGIANYTYYSSGDILGFGSVHALALLAACTTAAALASSLSLAWAPVIAVGAIATVATGARSALVGLAFAGLARMVAAGVRLRMIVIAGAAVAAIFISGAAGVVEARFHRSEATGEYNSFFTFGSGRGGLYEVALGKWWHSSPIEWVIGTGLRTIPRFEKERFGEAFVGHSDIVEVGVQLGILGLIGLLLIWWVLFARVHSKLPLLVLATYALISGLLEFGASLVIGLLLTTGLKRARSVHVSGVQNKGFASGRPTPPVAQPRTEASM